MDLRRYVRAAALLATVVWAGCSNPEDAAPPAAASGAPAAAGQPTTGATGAGMSASMGGPGGGMSAAMGGSPTTPGGKTPKLLFITNSNADWWNAVEKGMLDGGAEFGATVEMRRNNGSVQGQVDKLREALSLTDVDGVAVSVLEANAPGIIDAMRELQKAGKVVIAIDSDISPEAADARSAYIGTNNVKAGEAAGRAAAALRPEGGRTVVFVGTSDAANARERRQGFFQGAGPKFPADKSETFDDGGDHTKAGTNVQNALSKYGPGGLDVLLGLWSYNAPAIAEQVARAPEVRKTVNVVTFDLDEAARDHIKNKLIDATVCQNPYEMGYLGVKTLKALVNKDEAALKELLPNGPVRETAVRVVVPSSDSPVLKNKEQGDEVWTIDEMNQWLESKGLRST